MGFISENGEDDADESGTEKTASILSIDNNALLAVILVELTTSTIVASKVGELRVSEISNLL